MEYFWIVLSVCLALVSLGASGLFTLFFALIAFLCGCLCIVYGISFSSSLAAKADNLIRHSRQHQDLTRLKVSVTDSEEACYSTSSLSISGSPAIDAPLSEILGYIFRDYVYSWHFKLTHSKAFPIQLQESVYFALKTLSRKIEDVDWMPFLTTRLVDDVASHVRLFKKARLAMRTRNKEDGKIVDLEGLFFDAEVAMEGNVCRDLASSIQQEELNYLQQLAELLLFLLLPKRDFAALPLRALTREALVNFALKPMLDHLSDPDFINQTILWIVKDTKIKHDVFISSIRYSENLDELYATRDVVSKDIGTLRSKDSEGEKNSSLKQQLNSLLYLRKVLDHRIHRLQSADTDSFGVPSQVDWNQSINPKVKLFILPLDIILKNSISLSYFIDFMASIGHQSYLFFYLNVEGWKVSAEQNIQALEVEGLKLQQEAENGMDKEVLAGHLKQLDQQRNSLTENMREAAHSIYEEYLSEKANPRVKIDESVIRKLIFKIRTELPDADWFDESQCAVFDKLSADERFLDAFRRGMGYVKLLAELDLLKDSSKSDDEDDGQSSLAGDEFSIYDTLSVNSSDGSSNSDPLPEEKVSVSSENLLDDGTKPKHKTHRRSVSSVSVGQQLQQQVHQQQQQQPCLKTEVVEFNTVKDGVKSYAVYTIIVRHVNEKGFEEVSEVYRRYSDFHTLHEKICSKFDKLSYLSFPSKKTFGNMERHVLETRRKMLDTYLKALLNHVTLDSNYQLMIILQRFLDQESFESQRSTQPLNMMKAVGSVRNSVKSVTHAVTSVPNNLFHTVDSVMDGITKALQFKQGVQTVADGKVGACLDSDTSENIPMRIMLLFMDEVFDLQERNQWLRRQIVSVLRQLVKAMFGDIVNRRIVDYFSQMTSPDSISSYLYALKQSWWPDGFPAAPRLPRDEPTKNRTRVAARAAIFSNFSDDLRRVIGSETAKSGILMLFDLLQHPVLNKRLAIVLLEGILETLFQEQDFKMIFQRLHSRSNRIKNELKNSQRKYADLRR